MNTNRKAFGSKGVTARADLGSPMGVDHHELPSGIFRLLRKHHDELSPTSIGDRLSQTVVAQHPSGVEGFYRDDSKPVNNTSRFLVDEVMPAIGDTLMDTGHDLSNLSSLRRSLLQLRQLSLSLGQSLLISSEKTGVGYLLTGREGGEGSQPNIDTHGRIAFRQWLRLILCGEAGIPLIILPSDGAGANFPERLTVQSNFNITHFSQLKTAVNMEPELGVSETIIPIVSLESGISGSLPSLHSPEKGTESLVQSIGHILKNLGVDVVETGALCFKLGDTLALLEIGKRFLLFLPSIPALFQKFIIEPAALIKLRLQKISLMLSGIEPIFKSLIHYLNYILKRGWCQANSSPALKSGAFLA